MPFINPHPLYGTWCAMKARCYNKNNSAYKNYGGRGISICDKWKNSFHAFSEDMGVKPYGFTIDRIDNNKGYSPENCKWSSKKEQQRNQSVTRFVIIKGERFKACDLSDISGLKTDTIVDRVNKGLSLEQVLSKAKNKDLSGLKLGGLANGARNKAKTHCKFGHPFNAENTRIVAKGRACKKCCAIREKNRRIAKT